MDTALITIIGSVMLAGAVVRIGMALVLPFLQLVPVERSPERPTRSRARVVRVP